MEEVGARGTVITFYSYKGGTGRSMALANVACLIGAELEERSRPVLAIDWDLEAPGLDRFLVGTGSGTEVEHPGLIEYFIALRQALENDPKLYPAMCRAEGWRALADAVDLESFVQRGVNKNVDLLGAGFQDEDYPNRIGSFDWVSFYQEFPCVFVAFPELLSSRYSFTLVDSRTGLTDAGGICTALLPEKLVTVFTPNEQSLGGVNRVTRRVLRFRSRSDDLRSLAIFPLPSRVELDEEVLRREWRGRYQAALEETLSGCYQLPSLDLSPYLDEVQIPQKGYYAYGEKVAVLEEERRESLALSTAYEKFALRLVALENPWDRAPVPTSLGAALTGVGPTPQERLRATEAAGEYDVFLSYTIDDAPMVKDLAKRLVKYGVRPWLDEEIRPGDDWQQSLTDALGRSKSLAVVVGSTGSIDPATREWINLASEREMPVIPVMLEDASFKDLPTELVGRSAVQLGSGHEGVDRLVWGITGIRPTKR